MSFKGGGGIEKLSQLEIDANKDWLDFILHNIKQLIIGDTLGSKTEGFSITTSETPASESEVMTMFDSNGLQRYRKDSGGKDAWLISDSAGGIKGNIMYSTPGSKPGIIITRDLTLGGLLTSRFDISNNDTRFRFGYKFHNDSLAIHSTGGVSIGNIIATGDGVFAIKNGSVPSSSPADGIQLYAEDVSSSSELKVRDEAGNVTVLSPHAFEDGIIERTNPLDWIYRSENKFAGKGITVSIFELIKEVERLGGKSLLKVYDLEPSKVENWNDNQEKIRLQRQSEITEETKTKTEFDEHITRLEQKKIDAMDLEEKDKIQKRIDDDKELTGEIIVPEIYIKKTKPAWLDLPLPDTNVVKRGLSASTISNSSQPSRLRRITNALRLTSR